MEEKKLVPKRRFRGFEEDWISRPLSEIADIVMGHSPKSLNYTNNPKDPILVQGNADIKNNRIIPRLWTTEITQIANIGDIILTVRAPVGEVAKTDYNVVLGRGVSAIKGNEFLYQYLLKLRANRYWTTFSTGSTFDSINSDDINSLTFVFPNKKEQQKIGQFFKMLDKRIANQEKKIAKVKALKEAYLTEMFPKEGETVPQRRFKGFSEEWRERGLLEIVDLAVDNRGKTPPLNKNGLHPLIEVVSLGSRNPDYKKVQKYIDTLTYKNFLRDYLQANDILFSTVGRIGLVSLMDDNPYALIAQNIVGFRAKKDYCPSFLYALFSNKDSINRANRIVMGAVQPSVKVSQLIYVKYVIPECYKEQQKIGEFFKNLDDQIETEERKLAKLKAMKEAYLEEMFV